MPLSFSHAAVTLPPPCSAISGTAPDDTPAPARDAGPPTRDTGPGPPPDTGPLDPDTGPPVCMPACDDSILCTIDDCIDGACQSSPDNTACPAGMLCDP